MKPEAQSGPARSLAILEERIASVVGAVRQTLSLWPRDAAGLWAGTDRWVCTGAGGSEGPARALASLLRGLGAHAVFVPLSEFAIDAAQLAARRARLVVFSQALSPNARLALACRDRFDTPVLVTAAGPQQELTHQIRSGGGIVLAHPPEEESGLFIRVIGPAAATAVSMLLAAELAGTGDDEARLLARTLDGLDAVRDRARTELPPLLDGFTTLALVTAGGYGELVHGLRWKLLEGLGIPDPPVWDVLQVAHGPFQQFFDSRILLCGLELPDPKHAALFDRLEQMLVPGRHRLLRLRASSSGRAAWFEHDAMLNELVLASLRARPRDLIDWPGKGADASLYRLGPS